MVKEVANLPDDENFSLAEVLERHEAFYSLQPHLSQNVISEIYRCRTIMAGSTIGAALTYMLKEIGELEKEWGLV